MPISDFARAAGVHRLIERAAAELKTTPEELMLRMVICATDAGDGDGEPPATPGEPLMRRDPADSPSPISG
ncbi:hypothetical protein LPN01_08260 [Sphingomonas sp. A2-49]|uniref:hypothetical protein n=1 Tax=Sphingomonas sp. A2-49 TaxID=1391375 RepID=UPI0021CE9095|nr:hypothetical protein [Sphingomonas sp. A2-49]MCU6454068.1 hypothetical protein [Sphingomonas sp. A2-49]